MKKTGIIIVEDHAFTRQTLVYELKRAENINVLSSFENGRDAVEFVFKTAPDAIIMDIDMPVMNGIDATKEIKKFNPEISVIILTCHNEKEKVFDAFSSGANAYCVKNIEINELLRVIDIVNDGGVWFDKQIAKFIFNVLQNIDIKKAAEPKKDIVDYGISPRERNVLKLMADGLSNVEIAEKLVISPNTVRNHIASIMAKLNINDRAGVAIFALKNNLL